MNTLIAIICLTTVHTFTTFPLAEEYWDHLGDREGCEAPQEISEDDLLTIRTQILNNNINVEKQDQVDGVTEGPTEESTK